jgi:hypothetical protein
MSNILICMANLKLKTKDNFTLLSLNSKKWKFVGCRVCAFE